MRETVLISKLHSFEGVNSITTAVAKAVKKRQIDKSWIVIMQILMIFIDIERSRDREFLDEMVAIYFLVPWKNYKYS